MLSLGQVWKEMFMGQPSGYDWQRVGYTGLRG